jgi:hypothetical protein
MRQRVPVPRRSARAAVALALGVSAGIASAAWSTAAAGPASTTPSAVFDATHLPPLLTVTGETATLAYDVQCVAEGEEDVDAGCAATGTAYVRGVGTKAFEALPLRSGLEQGRRQLTVVVPDRLGARRGFEYYAVLEAPDLDRQIVLPAGGAAAPHVSLALDRTVVVQLGRHAFGSEPRDADRVAFAEWGDGSREVGLERGRNLDPIGGSAFDVDGRGGITLLDQVNRRLLRWTKGGAARSSVPVSVNGTLADLALGNDGSVFVLETTSPPGTNPMIRRFDDGGRELEAIESAEQTPSQIRVDERGPVVLARPSHHWMPALVDGVPASPRRQRELGRSGRRLAGGSEIVVFRHANEIRIAIVAGHVVSRSWRVTSATPLAEVQLADVWGQRVVVVVRIYDDTVDEFGVLVLARDGLVDRFTVDSADWAEAAPLARFERAGPSLFRLGSSPAGAFVDRFDLEVR